MSLVKGTLQISLKVSPMYMYFATQNKALIELVCQPNKPFFYRVFAQKEAELVRHMEEEKQGVEEEKMKVAKMKEDLEKERLRRAMGVNIQKFSIRGFNAFLANVFSFSFCLELVRTTNQSGWI